MDEPVTQQLVHVVDTIVRERIDGQAAGHGMDHVLRVLASARLERSRLMPTVTWALST